MACRTCFLILVLTAGISAVAQDVPALSYLDHSTREAWLKRLVSDAQSRGLPVRVVEVATSRQGRRILAVEMGFDTDPGSPPRDAPGSVRRMWGRGQAMLLVAGLESDRLAGCAVLEHLLETMLASTSDGLRTRLQQHELYVIPCANPDGMERYFNKAGPRDDRKGNGRNVDWDRDGRMNEDPPKDLDGDGLILQMRIKEDEGDLMVDPDDPHVMRKADPNKGERGLYTLHPEGLDADGDGSWAEDGPVGVEINRNFSHQFSEHDQQAGTFATSEPEVRGLIEYCMNRPNIATVLSLGAHDNLVELPKIAKKPKASKEQPDSGGRSRFRRRRPKLALEVQADDKEIFVELGKSWKKLTKLQSKNAGKTGGAFHEWAYFQRGMTALSANPFQVSDPDKAGKKGSKSKGREEKPESREESEDSKEPQKASEKDLVALHVEERRKSGFVPWKTITHEAFGDRAVEIGGWKPYARTTPSSEIAYVIAERVISFVDELLGKFSHIHLEDLKVKSLGRNLYEVKATILNDGWLPSATAQGRVARAVRPTLVELEVKKEDLVHGSRRHLIDRMEGRAGARHFRWLLKGSAGDEVELRIAPPRSRCETRKVVLP